MLLYIGITLWIFVLTLFGLKSYSNAAVTVPGTMSKHRSSKLAGVVVGITLLVLWVLTAFRAAEIGNDTETYIYYFDIFARGGVDFSRSFEIGYQVLNVIIGKFTLDPHVFLIVISTILYGLSAVFLFKYSKNPLIALCLFYCVCFSCFTSMLRQGIAMVIAVFGYYLLKEGKNVKAALLFAFATLFHASAAVCFLLFINTTLFKKKRVMYCVTIAIAVLSMFGVFDAIVIYLFPQYEHYFSGQYASSGWLAVTYELIRNVIFFTIASYTVSDNPRSDRLVVANMAFLMLFSSLGYSVNLFTRASEYFLLISVVELPNAMHSSKIKNKTFTMFLICTVLLLMFLVVLKYRPNWNHLYPYKFWENW